MGRSACSYNVTCTPLAHTTSFLALNNMTGASQKARMRSESGESSKGMKQLNAIFHMCSYFEFFSTYVSRAEPDLTFSATRDFVTSGRAHSSCTLPLVSMIALEEQRFVSRSSQHRYFGIRPRARSLRKYEMRRSPFRIQIWPGLATEEAPRSASF